MRLDLKQPRCKSRKCAVPRAFVEKEETRITHHVAGATYEFSPAVRHWATTVGRICWSRGESIRHGAAPKYGRYCTQDKSSFSLSWLFRTPCRGPHSNFAGWLSCGRQTSFNLCRSRAESHAWIHTIVMACHRSCRPVSQSTSVLNNFIPKSSLYHTEDNFNEEAYRRAVERVSSLGISPRVIAVEATWLSCIRYPLHRKGLRKPSWETKKENGSQARLSGYWDTFY